MNQERVLKVVLVVVGLLFVGLAYPLVMFFSRLPEVAMMMSIYVTLGIFLLLAARNPAANRSLIAFAGWANLAHAAVMSVQEYRHIIEPREIPGVILFGVIGLALIALTPGKKSAERISVAGA
jgi:succinate-acetate transporter protein